jgi:hypothetical protein
MRVADDEWSHCIVAVVTLQLHLYDSVPSTRGVILEALFLVITVRRYLIGGTSNCVYQVHNLKI